MAAANIEVRKPNDAELESLGVRSWPTWTKEPSTFDWRYDESETCYLLEGDVEVTTSEGTVKFGAGDLVTFPSGLSCTWTVKVGVRKHYKFG
jgi:uncharacterized cupin superfamily protein